MADNPISNNVLQVIHKHRGAVINVIFKDMKKNTFISSKGTLKNLNSSMIQLSNPSAPNGAVNIKFYENNIKKIYAIFNRNDGELLTMTQAEPLNKKLRNAELQKKIIRQVKSSLNKEVAVIYKNSDNDKLLVLHGEFSDMGIQDLVVRPAPFHNRDERVRYNAILSIFDEQGRDLLYVPPLKK